MQKVETIEFGRHQVQNVIKKHRDYQVLLVTDVTTTNNHLKILKVFTCAKGNQSVSENRVTEIENYGKKLSLINRDYEQKILI